MLAVVIGFLYKRKERTKMEETTTAKTMNKADTAIKFLDDYSKWAVQLIEILKNFFERIAEIFKSE